MFLDPGALYQQFHNQGYLLLYSARLWLIRQSFSSVVRVLTEAVRATSIHGMMMVQHLSVGLQ